MSLELSSRTGNAILKGEFSDPQKDQRIENSNNETKHEEHVHGSDPYQPSYWESCKAWIHALAALLTVDKEVCPRRSRVRSLSEVAP